MSWKFKGPTPPMPTPQKVEGLIEGLLRKSWVVHNPLIRQYSWAGGIGGVGPLDSYYYNFRNSTCKAKPLRHPVTPKLRFGSYDWTPPELYQSKTVSLKKAMAGRHTHKTFQFQPGVIFSHSSHLTFTIGIRT